MRHGLRFPAVALTSILGIIASPAPSYAGRLTIDRDHSNVGFSVRHLFTRVSGRFRDFEGTVVFDEADLAASSVSATIQVTSIDTNVEARDKDLRSPRFFDAGSYPRITFQSRSVKTVPGGRFEIAGTLTMHGVTKEIALDLEFLGKGKDPWGNLRYGFRALTRINRKEFGMAWNEVIETGGVLVGDEVEIVLDIEAIASE